MAHIKLTKNKYTVVDDDMFAYLNQWKWHLSGNRYASRTQRIKGTKKRIRIFLHKLVVKCPKSKEVDHRNGDIFDNRRKNLRICSHSNNSKNQKLHKDSTSGFKGVAFYKRNRKWCAYITVQYKRIYLGLFIDKLDAARAYNRAARKYHKNFANLNQVNE